MGKETEKYFPVLSVSKFRNTLIAKFIGQLLTTQRAGIKKVYQDNKDKTGLDFISSIINKLKIKFEYNEEELKRIPKSGAFITVSNHPFGGLDGLILIKILCDIRPDYKVFANYLLHRIDPIKGLTIPINEYENDKIGQPDETGIFNAFSHLRDGFALGIFPSGELISTPFRSSNMSDRRWRISFLKLIKIAKVPIVPVYFQGNHSWFLQLLGGIHPVLQTLRVPSDIFIKKRIIQIRIGNPITVKDLDNFPNTATMGRFLRAKTYALGTPLKVRPFFNRGFINIPKEIQPVISAVNPDIIETEIKIAIKGYLLFKSNEFSIICAPTVVIPNILTEIGRLREITFREIGEGTNLALDLDEFDLYFHHLIIWDEKSKKIVGAYRVGKGNEILAQYGIKGFYIQTLFQIRKEFYPILNETLELGRSFIVKEYQRKPLSLFLLWKGILYFLLKNQEYRFLIGPASISNDFSKFSKNMIVGFFEKNFYHKELSRYIRPRKKFKVRKFNNIDSELVIKNTNNDLNKLDKFIQDIEPNYRIPVLLKKYISLNAKILGFNIDPKFNDCIDGLMILDIFDVPYNTLKSLSKEINDESILDRFNITEQ